MSRCGVFLVLVLAACTKANPAAHCQSGTCTDPNFPFCDVNGVVSGEPGACVAVSCTAGAFAECRENAEVRCNATGDNYDVVQCERGCDAAADGCRLCNPNETACTNGKVATCDASGTVTSSTACPLGCFESEPRCRDIAPSNELGKYRDQVVTPPALDLADATIDTTNGQIMTANGTVVVPSTLVPAPNGGAAIRVIVASSVHLRNVAVITTGDVQFGKGPALAIVATGDVTVDGELSAVGSNRASGGGVDFAGCTGGLGQSREDGGGFVSMSGDGGGGHATPGGFGGEILGRLNAGTAGLASGTESLVPLRGGCSGGVSGGGAIQITSSTKVTVNGVINANGGGALRYQEGIAGGGAGGGILLEAPTVELGASSKLLANGGGGAALDEDGSMSETLAAAPGGKCSPGSMFCGAGGDGASTTTPARDGVTPPATNGNNTFAGGGGGGLGRIRINTVDGNYVKSTGTIEAGALTTGKIVTR